MVNVEKRKKMLKRLCQLKGDLGIRKNDKVKKFPKKYIEYLSLLIYFRRLKEMTLSDDELKILESMEG